MGEVVSLSETGGIATITIDNPPVNAISRAVRQGLLDAIAALRGRPDIRGLVLACAGRTFCAGADISEFGKALEPSLPEVIAALEALGLPSVAAIHGTALGGGFELTLGCHYRLAQRGSYVGLPEVTLGLLPGAGGTVRGTYLCGAAAALDIMTSGRRVPAAEAQGLGLVDALVAGDPAAEARTFLQERLAEGALAPQPIARAPDMDPTSFDALAAPPLAKMRSEAPRRVVAALRNALALPPEEALKAERALFLAAVASPQSAALRHLFFAERESARLPEAEAQAVPRPVASVGVIGAGTMGAGIAMAFANAGLPVVLRDIDAPAVDRGIERIAETYARSVARGSLAAGEVALRQDRITGTTALADLAGCDLIVEAAFEDMAVKQAIFRDLDRLAKPGAILATNTSYLDVNEIAAATARPGDVLGLHFFSPANVMKLLEVVRGAKTAPEVMATAFALARQIGKVAVPVGVCRGFVGNRMLAARNRALPGLLLEGATPEGVDAAFRAFGWPMGPFEMQDMAGLDISWRNRKGLGQVEPVADRLCEAGRIGQKAGRGWYDYAAGSRTPLPSAEVAEVIAGIADAQGLARREIAANEIISRTHGPMVAEGRAILDEGIAARASDIDVIWVLGYGFPRDLGGPMFWAERTNHVRTPESESGLSSTSSI